MFSVEEADSWIGLVAVGIAGERIGKITRIWVDDQSGQPTWASVTTGLLGRRETVVPLAGFAPSGRAPRLAYSKSEIKGAPDLDEDGRLGLDDEWQLFRYYGLAGAQDPTSRPARPCDDTEDTTRLSTDGTHWGAPGGPSWAPGGGTADRDTRRDVRRAGVSPGGASRRVLLADIRRGLGLDGRRNA